VHGVYINFYGKENGNHQLGTGFLVDHRTVPAVKTAEFVSDKMSYTLPEVAAVLSF